MFSIHEMEYIWYLPNVSFLFLLYFLEDIRLIELQCLGPYSIKDDKGLFVTEYLDQAFVILTFSLKKKKII